MSIRCMSFSRDSMTNVIQTNRPILLTIMCVPPGGDSLAPGLQDLNHSFCKGDLGCKASAEADNSGDGTATDVSSGGSPPSSDSAMPCCMERSPPVKGVTLPFRHPPHKGHSSARP